MNCRGRWPVPRRVRFVRRLRPTNKNNGVKSARDNFFYSDDDGLLVAMRKGDYKASFTEQRMQGTLGVWGEPFTVLPHVVVSRRTDDAGRHPGDLHLYVADRCSGLGVQDWRLSDVACIRCTV